MEVGPFYRRTFSAALHISTTAS